MGDKNMDNRDKTTQVEVNLTCASIVITDGKSVHLEKINGSEYTLPSCKIQSNIRSGWYDMPFVQEEIAPSLMSILENLGYTGKISKFTELYIDRRKNSICIGVKLKSRKRVNQKNNVVLADIIHLLRSQHTFVASIMNKDIIPTLQ